VIVRITHRKKHRSFYCETLLSVTSVRVIFNQWGGVKRPNPDKSNAATDTAIDTGMWFRSRDGLETHQRLVSVSVINYVSCPRSYFRPNCANHN